MLFLICLTGLNLFSKPSGIRLELEGGDDKNNTFSPGEIIRGKITIEDSKHITKDKEGRAYFRCYRICSSSRKEEKNWIFPNYKEKIKGKIEWNKDNNNVIQFETHIPKEIRRSYIEKYSEYYWLLEAKVDIPWSDDLSACTIIQIV